MEKSGFFWFWHFYDKTFFWLIVLLFQVLGLPISHIILFIFTPTSISCIANVWQNWHHLFIILFICLDVHVLQWRMLNNFTQCFHLFYTRHFLRKKWRNKGQNGKFDLKMLWITSMLTGCSLDLFSNLTFKHEPNLFFCWCWALSKKFWNGFGFSEKAPKFELRETMLTTAP